MNFLSTATTEAVEDYFHDKFPLNLHVFHIVLALLTLLQKEFHFVGIESLVTGVHEENKYFGLKLVLNEQLLGFLYTVIYRYYISYSVCVDCM